MRLSKRERIWAVQYVATADAENAVREMGAKEGLLPLTAKVLYSRGCHTPQSALDFLQMSEETMHDPFLMADARPAVARIRRAIEEKERIAIYGDYDVDGVTSVSLLYLFLKKKGADVGYYIPSRLKDGYGVTTTAIDMLAEERGVSLIITVDTGITAINETAYASERGIDMVITDHHECYAELPKACAVVNPHRPDCAYPFKDLAGVGVIFKLLCAYEMEECERRGEAMIEGVRQMCREYADLVALGTVADVMPVIGENRILVAMGIRMIANPVRCGVAALVDATLPSTKLRGGVPIPLTREERDEQRRKRVNSGLIGFGLAPRINAAGRISSASRAVELLLADSEEQATVLAKELCEINARRQLEENRVAEEAYAMIEKTWNPERDRVIVLDHDRWPQGIIGIVSSRVTERYGLPSILISFEGSTTGMPHAEDIGKGSGRSIKGLNLVEALMTCEDLLIRFGGHELAAGMSICRGNIERFRYRINEYARERLDEEALIQHLDADCVVSAQELTIEQAEQLSLLEPCGVANPTPQFVVKDMTVLRIVPMGGGKHSKLTLSREGMTFCAVCFGVAPLDLGCGVSDRVDVLFQLNVNEYQGERTLQLIVQDIRCADSYLLIRERERLRYEEIRNGASFDDEQEKVLPDREDFALVYTFLRRESRLGNTTFTDKALLSALETGAPGKICYIKLKFILRILQELQICGVSEPEEGLYIFDIYFTPNKTSIEKSSILKKLRGQCRKKG